MSPHRKTTLIAAVAKGRLDTLSPVDVAALSELLNADDTLAAQVAAMPARQQSWSEPAVATPSGAEWDRVWAGVSSEVGAAASPSRGVARPATMRAWSLRPFAAAAVCVLMVSVLTRFRPALANPPLELDRASEIATLDVSDDCSAFVVDCEDSGPIVWVVENDE